MCLGVKEGELRGGGMAGMTGKGESAQLALGQPLLFIISWPFSSAPGIPHILGQGLNWAFG